MANFTILAVTPQLNADGAESLVFHVILFLLIIVGFLILLRLPRAFARFRRSSDWLNGHFLWHSSYPKSTSKAPQTFPDDYPSEDGSTKETKDGSTDDSHTLYSHAKKARGQSDDIVVSFPPHVATCPRFLRQLVTLHRARIAPGFSISQAFVMVFYFATLVYASFYKSSPFSDPVRTGWVAIAQLPFAFALATKNNILGMLLGFTYEKLNYLHRFIGRLIVIAVNIHSLGYFYKWSIAGIFQRQISRPSAMWGLVGLIALDTMWFFSLSFWRSKFHNIMFTTHIIGFSLGVPALWLHKPSMIPWLAACLGLYGLDRVLRVLKTRIATAVLRPLPELKATRIEVPHINRGWRAGQHVRLRVLSFGVGWWGWTEVHPFTIASVGGTEEGLVLIAKKSGRWTGALYDMAKSSGYTEAGYGRRVKVIIEGPYGGPGHAIFASYSAAVFVVGGSGITFALSTIQDLIQKDLKGQSRVKTITLIWVVQDPASLHPLLPLFASMVQDSVYTPVHIAVHYTRAVGGEKPPAQPRVPGMTLAPGRPKVAKVLEGSLSRAVALGAGVKDEERVSGMLVGVCGPPGLGDDVSRAVATIEPARRDQVGGIEMHEEVFGL
ncbi:hypothetical protein D9615_005461 [Tricholomella constricta]|uniref:ferric-chelate reductase (NADPH) n=1 Tax=Tricholomella constricta TaxID=117010 RepID=A0A8H5HE21_9AGAR|nr:hypothetical protein D9615_005461 [Tricholomella constricta]